MKLYNNELTKYPFIVVKVSYFSEKEAYVSFISGSPWLLRVDNSIYISAGQEAAVFTSLYGAFT